MTVHEVDGPPVSSFKIGRKVQYLTLCEKTETEANANDRVSYLVSVICHELDRIGGGLIVWRCRPEIAQEADTPVWKYYMRLETIPALPAKFWDGMPVKEEGAKAKWFYPVKISANEEGVRMEVFKDVSYRCCKCGVPLLWCNSHGEQSSVPRYMMCTTAHCDNGMKVVKIPTITVYESL